MSTARTVSVGIVEDSDEDFFAFSRAFRRYPANVQLTRWSRAEALLERLDGRTSPPQIDVLLVDLSLPGIDGVELVRRIRGGRGGLEVPVFVLSGSDRPGDVERSYAAGANGYFQKTSNASDLDALLSDVLSATGRENGAPGDARAPSHRPRLRAMVGTLTARVTGGRRRLQHLA